MKTGVKYILGALAAATLWWLYWWLQSSTYPFLNFDWPSETGGLTSKFVMQIGTFAVLSVPAIAVGCLIVHEVTKKSRLRQEDKE